MDTTKIILAGYVLRNMKIDTKKIEGEPKNERHIIDIIYVCYYNKTLCSKQTYI